LAHTKARSGAFASGWKWLISVARLSSQYIHRTAPWVIVSSAAHMLLRRLRFTPLLARGLNGASGGLDPFRPPRQQALRMRGDGNALKRDHRSCSSRAGTSATLLSRELVNKLPSS
jgi:hypothetical protein